MGQMLNLGNELVRISPKNPERLEFSTNDGRSWMTRFSGGSIHGEFQDLTENGDEILAHTSKGLFFSKNSGRSWMTRRKN